MAAPSSFSAGDVPEHVDLVIGDDGFLFAVPAEERAAFSFTPTFVTRSNIQGSYGDNQQDFWLTYTAKDWSRGEQLKYARPNDEEAASRYWQGTNIDISRAGQVGIARGVESIVFGGSVRALTAQIETGLLFTASATNLYEVAADGTITDRGAHGLGATPRPYSMVCDNPHVFFSTTSAGSVGVRRWTGGVFGTFSSGPADALAFLNNTLYGYRGDTGALVRYDTAGAATTLFTWQSADGANAPLGDAPLIPFGGKLAILRTHENTPSGAELWIYDGVAPAKAAQFPANFYAHDLCEAFGTIFFSGSLRRQNGATVEGRPVVFAYTNGSLLEVWKSDSYFATGKYHPSVTAFDGGVVWNDDIRGQLMFYDPILGAVSSVGAYTANGNETHIKGGAWSLLMTRTQTTGYLYPDTSTVASTATITTPLADFDSGLSKLFRGITVEYDEGSDGDGGSIDIAYRIGDLDGAYTTLQTGAVSGTEYALSNITGRSISVKITLNKGTSTNGPLLKRIAIRVAPQHPGFRRETYRLALLGRDGEGHMETHSGLKMPKDGKEMADDLRSAISSATPLTITDEFGTYTGVAEPDKCQIVSIRRQEYLATVTFRSV